MTDIRLVERDRAGLGGVAKLMLYFVGAVLVASALYLLALTGGDRLLSVRDALPARVDTIVVLGGDGPSRAAKAASLYRARVAPRVLVTGDGDCTSIRRSMMEAGVPFAAITLECASRNTWENAQLSAPLLREAGVQTAVLVTSWFHTRRAITCFTLASPQIQWFSAPTEQQETLWQLATSARGIQLAKEYPKAVGYSILLALRGVWITPRNATSEIPKG